jgi:hypothetical protein
VTQAQANPRLRGARGALAVVELLLAACLVLLAVWMWGHGQQQVRYHVGSSQYAVTSIAGNWAGGAIAVCLPAGLAVIDATRRLALIRTRS